jgi:hypothetical protein
MGHDRRSRARGTEHCPRLERVLRSPALPPSARPPHVLPPVPGRWRSAQEEAQPRFVLVHARPDDLTVGGSRVPRPARRACSHRSEEAADGWAALFPPSSARQTPLPPPLHELRCADVARETEGRRARRAVALALPNETVVVHAAEGPRRVVRPVLDVAEIHLAGVRIKSRRLPGAKGKEALQNLNKWADHAPAQRRALAMSFLVRWRRWAATTQRKKRRTQRGISHAWCRADPVEHLTHGCNTADNAASASSMLPPVGITLPAGRGAGSSQAASSRAERRQTSRDARAPPLERTI